LGAVEAATAEAAKHAGSSDALAALVAEARGMLEQAKAEQAERARVAVEEAEAAAAEEAEVERGGTCVDEEPLPLTVEA
jgi:hypothetical protein